MVDPTPIRDRYAALSPQLDERGRRHFAASEARAAGHGGMSARGRATGVARSTPGCARSPTGGGLKTPASRFGRRGGGLPPGGGGQKPLTEVDAMLLDD